MKVAFVLLLAFLAVALATPYGRMRPVKTVPNWVDTGAKVDAPFDCTIELGIQCASVIAGCASQCTSFSTQCLDCVGSAASTCCPCLQAAFPNFPC
ncbi:uncharacterized protein ACA1_391370 [Acanthamoeba castellanii str. Neff]|jgi:hypothetical protein|uniref:Uncharacterized protein n=1 Tax=Acanthamoeba castellanii (strain ATCC 30010 / Neff) TaxID=1257118 RepID=L8GNV8_ACACF|nr:uncharacterized protein ACA1_391370 [Acanthamoeba castellanii str. Neff]ELR14769.1 hypothetical protein ACA1_391370 [Acanthamoeba castellanii str. Neff]